MTQPDGPRYRSLVNVRPLLRAQLITAVVYLTTIGAVLAWAWTITGHFGPPEPPVGLSDQASGWPAQMRPWPGPLLVGFIFLPLVAGILGLVGLLLLVSKVQ